MGTTQSKEEVIIAQAGNSGGQTNGVSFNAMGVKEIMEMVMIIICIIIILVYCHGKCKKQLEKKVRREIVRSQELV